MSSSHYSTAGVAPATTTTTTQGQGLDPAMAFVADMQQAAAPKVAKAPEVTVEQLLHVKKVEVQAKELKAREEALETKAREEQMKSFARSAKLATEASLAQKERDQQIQDTPAAREDALHQFGQLREMGVPGTGKRLTADSPLTAILLENEVMHQQLNKERATDLPIVVVHGLVRAAAQFPPLYNLHGAADDLERLYETSQRGETREERAYYRTMQQLSIKYGGYFTTGPEMFVLMQVIQVLKLRWDFNRQSTALAQGQSEVDDATTEALRGFEQPQQPEVARQTPLAAQAPVAAEQQDLNALGQPRQQLPDGPTEMPKRGGRSRKGGQ